MLAIRPAAPSNRFRTPVSRKHPARSASAISPPTKDPVQVPSPEDEDARTLQRLLDKLLAAKERLTNHILAVLFAQSIDRKYDIWLKDDKDDTGI